MDLKNKRMKFSLFFVEKLFEEIYCEKCRSADRPNKWFRSWSLQHILRERKLVACNTEPFFIDTIFALLSFYFYCSLEGIEHGFEPRKVIDEREIVEL